MTVEKGPQKAVQARRAPRAPRTPAKPSKAPYSDQDPFLLATLYCLITPTVSEADIPKVWEALTGKDVPDGAYWWEEGKFLTLPMPEENDIFEEVFLQHAKKKYVAEQRDVFQKLFDEMQAGKDDADGE